MNYLLGLVVILCVGAMAGLSHEIYTIKKQNRQLQEDAVKYLNGLFLGMNKGGYKVVIRDDVINVKCKAERWTIDDERK